MRNSRRNPSTGNPKGIPKTISEGILLKLVDNEEMDEFQKALLLASQQETLEESQKELFEETKEGKTQKLLKELSDELLKELTKEEF